MIDPWLINWMKQQVIHPDMQRNICHLKMFIHDSRTIEVSLGLMKDLHQISSNDAYWVLKDLQGLLDSEKHPLTNLKIPLSYPPPLPPTTEQELKLNH